MRTTGTGRNRSRRALFALLAFLLLAIASCGPADTGEPGQTPGSQEPGQATGEQVSGRDTNLPLYPGAVRIEYEELADGVFSVEYTAQASLETVIEYYKTAFADRADVTHGDGIYTQGDYTFETAYAQIAEEAFILTLSAQGSEGTVISVMAGSNYFD